MKNLTIALFAATLSLNVAAASVSSSITNGYSTSHTTVQQHVTGKIKSFETKVTGASEDFSLGNGRCGRDVCSGDKDVGNVAGTGSFSQTKVVNILDERTTGSIVDTNEFCETSITAGNVTASSGFSTSTSTSHTLTERNNLTKVKGYSIEVSKTKGEAGYAASVTTTKENYKVADTSFTNTESYSETVTSYSSAR